MRGTSNSFGIRGTGRLAIGGGAPPFDVLATNPSIWLDASDGATLFDAESGGSVVTGTGTVKRIADKSGLGRDFVGSVGGTKTAADFNGRTAIHCAASGGQGFQHGTPFTTPAVFERARWEFICVARQHTDGFRLLTANRENNPDYNGQSVIPILGSGGYRGGMMAFMPTATDTSVHEIYDSWLVRNGTTSSDHHFARNGVEAAPVNVAYQNEWLNVFTFGNGYDGSGLDYGGETTLMELIAYYAPVDGTTRAAVTAYLAEKWGI